MCRRTGRSQQGIAVSGGSLTRVVDKRAPQDADGLGSPREKG